MWFPGLCREVCVVDAQVLSAGAAGQSPSGGAGCPNSAGSSLLQPMPPQGTAEPLSQDGGSLRKMYLMCLRKGKKMLPGSEKWGKMWNNLADTEVREEGGKEVLRAPEQRLPYSPWRRPRQSRFMRNKRVKLSLEKSGGRWGEGAVFFVFSFVSHHPSLF